MDDVPIEGLPDEGQDRDATAALAEMAAALAGAGASQATDGSNDSASETPPGRGKRLRQLFNRLPQVDIRGRLNPRRWTRPRLRLDRRQSRRAAALMLAAALVLGFSGSIVPVSGRAPTATQRLIAAASATTVPSSSASLPANGSPSAAPSSSAAPSPTALPASPSVPSQTSPTATITFTNLMLDSVFDFPRSARTFSFTSDGPGTVSAQIVASSPLESTVMCVTVDDAPQKCDLGVTPELTQTATSVHSHWTIALISGNGESPSVDVQFSWPTENPQITVNHARFQGFPNPDSLRALSATFTTRTAGRLGVDASWPPAAVDATLTLTNVSSANPTAVDKVAYPGRRAISPIYSHALKGGRIYKLDLFNGSPDAARPDLKVTIAFP